MSRECIVAGSCVSVSCSAVRNSSRLTRCVFGALCGQATRVLPISESTIQAALNTAHAYTPCLFQDERFADNPLVIGSPHIRFYAGAPLQLPSGSRVGTLCAIDSRPRDLDPSQIQLLKDLASLVVEQLVKMPCSVHTAHPAASSIGASVPEIFEAAAKKPIAPTSAIVPTASTSAAVTNPAESETPAQQTSNAAG